MKFLIFSGTIRQGQSTEHVAEFVLKHCQTVADTQWEWIDPRHLGLTYQDEGQGACPPELQQKVAEADGYIVVAPEYNHGYPGTIKYLLDLNLKEYRHKPIGFVGVSARHDGGIRMIEGLVTVSRELGLVACSKDVNIPKISDQLENGQLKDPGKWSQRLDRLLAEFLWLATTLKHGREHFPVQEK